MPKRTIDKGSNITIEVEVSEVWPDGRFTFHLRGYPSPITISEDSPEIVKVVSPPKAKRLRVVPD